MLRKMVLVVVLSVLAAPAFLLAGCQTSSTNRSSAMGGDAASGQASYPKYSSHYANDR